MRGLHCVSGAGILVMAAAALLPVPAVAQGTVAGRAEAVFWNRHHWRGIRRAEVPVFSAGGVVALRLGGRGALSLGGTGRFELAESRPGRPSDLPFGRWGLSEGAVRVGLDTPGIGVGILWTGHPRRGDVGYVTEATLRLEHASRDLTPRLDLAWDLGGRRGGYLEASLRRVIANPVAGPGVNLVLDLSTGLAFDTDSPRTSAPASPIPTSASGSGSTCRSAGWTSSWTSSRTCS